MWTRYWYGSIDMRMLVRRLGAFVVAVLLTHIVASALVTQHTLARVAKMGLAVPPDVRLSSTLHDVLGMSSSYLPLIAIGLLVAFGIAAFLTRFAPGLRTALFALAGAVALIAINLTLELAFEIVPVASARTVGGLLAQGGAGALGGFLFATLVRPSRTR